VPAGGQQQQQQQQGGGSALFSLVTYPLAVGLGFGLLAGAMRLFF
jgi:hypothetical protein